MSVRVRVEMRYTVNMGDYESYAIDYAIEDDARPGENARDAHKRVESLVSELVWAEVEEARKASKAVRPKPGAK